MSRRLRFCVSMINESGKLKKLWQKTGSCAILIVGQLIMSIQEAIDFLVYSRKASK